MVEFGILGPVLVRRNGVEVELTSMLQRLLGLLLARAGTPVTLDEILDALWGNEPPRTARKTVHVYIHRLRRLLGDDDLIARSPLGYRLTAAPESIDSHQFQALLRQAAEHTDPQRAGGLLARALGLWRGPAYAGLLDIPAIAAAAARLQESRLAAFEDHAAAELQRGRHHALVPRLTMAVGENPYRERLRGQLMVALQRSGRPSEALEAFRQARELLLREVGIEPGPELQRLHEQVLHSRPAPRTGSAYQFLPHDLPDFVGREPDLQWLDESPAGPTVISGAPGVGKTALAVRWGHRAAAGFPDGQLFVNLRGFDSGPALRPFEALAQLLRNLGVPRDRMPTEPEDAEARYRALLAGRKVLIVLDNAVSAEQVRPLLPGTPMAKVLITSRNRLSGLIAHDGARRLAIGLLPGDHALALLRRIVGAARVDAAPEAAQELVRLCAGLPLALRLAAANLADRETLHLDDFVADLAAGDRLAALAVSGDEDRAMRAVLDRSYEALPAATRHVYRLLGVAPGPDFTSEVASVLLGSDASPALEGLLAANLVEQPLSPRFSLHDLVREHAKGKAEPADQARLGALLGYFRDMAAETYSFLAAGGDGGAPRRLGSAQEAMAWLEAERGNVIAAVSAAAAAGELTLACDIARPLGQFFHLSGHTGDWVTTFESLYAGVEDLGETKAKYLVLNSLGNAYHRAGRNSDASVVMRRCIDGRDALGEAVAAGSSRHNLASIMEATGRYEEALELDRAALAIFREHQARAYEALVLGTGLSNVYQRMGRYQEALGCLLQAMHIEHELGNPFGLVRVLNNLGNTYVGLRENALALKHFEEGLELAQQVGDRYTQAQILGGISDVHRELGDYPKAIEVRQDTIELMVAAGRGLEAESQNRLADLFEAVGEPEKALAHYEAALEIARSGEEKHQEGLALAGIGRVTSSAEHLAMALARLESTSAAEAKRVRGELDSLEARARDVR